MADDGTAFIPINPYALARSEARAARIKRFYTQAAAARGDGAFVLQFDGRQARTPARRPVAVPTAAAAALLVDEWNRQGEFVNPGEMPVTRLVNSVIDGVANTMAAVRAEVVTYAGSDLVCYRAEGPAPLVERQAAAWDPVLALARDRWQARLYLAQGVIHVVQPAHALAAIESAIGASVGVGDAAPFRLGALHLMTTLTGSALLALAVLAGAFDAADAWGRAHVDEDFEISRWGEDAEATDRRARRWRDMQSAAALADAV